jgi:hypothetical protein
VRDQVQSLSLLALGMTLEVEHSSVLATLRQGREEMSRLLLEAVAKGAVVVQLSVAVEHFPEQAGQLSSAVVEVTIRLGAMFPFLEALVTVPSQAETSML